MQFFIFLSIVFPLFAQCQFNTPLEDNAMYWDSLISFPQNRLKKSVDLEGFAFVSPSEQLDFMLKEQDESHRTVSEAPNTFLYKSENLIGKANNSKVYCYNYGPSMNNFGYDFYVKQTEVTNAEYREFIDYVKDSIFLEALSQIEPDKFKDAEGEYEPKLVWKWNLDKIRQDPDYVEVYESFFDSDTLIRFYKRPQYKVKLLNYRYKNEKGEEQIVNIYPDTLKWIIDLNYSWNEPMAYMYNWHPVYDNYPVVGLNYHQIQAYLHWLRARGIKVLDKKQVDYVIDLPKPEEIEFTVSSILAEENKDHKGEKNIRFANFSRDQNVNLNLKVKEKRDSIYYDRTKNEAISQFLHPYSTPKYGMLEDDAIHTIISDYKSDHDPQLTVLGNEIYHLGSNVSEWLAADYQEYQDYFLLKTNTMLASPYNAINELGEELKSRLSKIDTNFKLVMGANWLDEKYNIRHKAPLEGIYAKTFIHPDSAFSTVGFRYLIRIKSDALKKSETKVLYRTYNVFESLKKAGFELVKDSTITTLNEAKELLFIHPKTKEELTQNNNNSVLDGAYIPIGVRGPYDYRILNKHHKEFIEELEGSGNRCYRLLSNLPNQPKNIVMEYKIEVINEHSLKLIRL